MPPHSMKLWRPRRTEIVGTARATGAVAAAGEVMVRRCWRAKGRRTTSRRRGGGQRAAAEKKLTAAATRKGGARWRQRMDRAARSVRAAALWLASKQLDGFLHMRVREVVRRGVDAEDGTRSCSDRKHAATRREDRAAARGTCGGGPTWLIPS